MAFLELQKLKAELKNLGCDVDVQGARIELSCPNAVVELHSVDTGILVNSATIEPLRAVRIHGECKVAPESSWLISRDGRMLARTGTSSNLRAQLLSYVADQFESKECLVLSVTLAKAGNELQIRRNFLPNEFWDDCASEAVALLLESLDTQVFLRNIQNYSTPVIAPYESVAALSQAKQALYPQEYFYKPVHVEVELTHKCTLACRQCSIIEDVRAAKHNLSVEVVSTFLRAGSKLGVYSYSLTGGEPFLRAGDLCKIIADLPELDCHKIQTNGTFFSSANKARHLLGGLVSSGWGRNNQYIRSILKCSIGIQSYAGDSYKHNLINILSAGEELAPVNIDFGVCYTVQNGEPSEDLYRLLRLLRSSNISESVIRRLVFSIFSVNYNFETYVEHFKESRAPLREVLSEVSGGWHCVSPSDSITPWPRMLLRADGSVYACSCFGHVFYLGSVYEASFFSLVQRANKNEAFKCIGEQGLTKLLQIVEEKYSAFGDRVIPTSSTRCQICKMIKSAWDTLEN